MKKQGENGMIQRWDYFELELEGPDTGNPFLDVVLQVTFKQGDSNVRVDGFYDGEGKYKCRFMPQEEGVWEYITASNVTSLDHIMGTFTCVEARPDNHGSVRVRNQFHFGYEDGSNYFPFGTTCYAWIHQPKELQEETLDTLQQTCFNKIRMCVFPKNYVNNSNEPELFPYEKNELNKFDFTRFHVPFFNHLEKRIMQLERMGIEVDLILFHPYDEGRWGFDRMSVESDERYLRYIVARLSAFHNIWWSMANEYDYMKEKTKEQWEHYIELVANIDPYHHLLSIHQGDVLFDHWNTHITHASIQLGTQRGIVTAGLGRLKLLRDAYHKPVIYDEVGYEGNLERRWGRSSAQELVDKFWQGIIAGTYTTHGETFRHPEDIIWWSKGGKLYGESPTRIAFLKKIVYDSGLAYMEPVDRWWALDGVGKNGEYYLYYFSYEKPTEWTFALPAFKIGVEIPVGTRFSVEIIDTWEMTITPVEERYTVTEKEGYNYICSSNPIVTLPGKPFIALRIKREKSEDCQSFCNCNTDSL